MVTKGTTINDLGRGPGGNREKKILAALLRGEKFFGGHSPGKKKKKKNYFSEALPGEKKFLVEKVLRPPPPQTINGRPLTGYENFVVLPRREKVGFRESFKIYMFLNSLKRCTQILRLFLPSS